MKQCLLWFWHWTGARTTFTLFLSHVHFKSWLLSLCFPQEVIPFDWIKHWDLCDGYHGKVGEIQWVNGCDRPEQSLPGERFYFCETFKSFCLLLCERCYVNVVPCVPWSFGVMILNGWASSSKGSAAKLQKIAPFDKESSTWVIWAEVVISLNGNFWMGYLLQIHFFCSERFVPFLVLV